MSAARAALLAAALAGVAGAGAVWADPAGDAQDRAALQAVCSRCHTLQLVTSQPRSEAEWTGLLQKMTDLGAKGTDAQFDAIGRYLIANLTAVNVNSASPDELARDLAVAPEIAEAIVARREQQPFRDLADLETVPGIDRSAMESRKGRIFF